MNIKTYPEYGQIYFNIKVSSLVLRMLFEMSDKAIK